MHSRQKLLNILHLFDIFQYCSQLWLQRNGHNWEMWPFFCHFDFRQIQAAECTVGRNSQIFYTCLIYFSIVHSCDFKGLVTIEIMWHFCDIWTWKRPASQWPICRMKPKPMNSEGVMRWRKACKGKSKNTRDHWNKC